MMEVIHRGKHLKTGKYPEGSLYIDCDDKHFILPKATLWRTESEGSDMRSVYVAHEIDPTTLAVWTQRVDKNGTKIFMACHGGDHCSEYRGADKIIRGGYSDPDDGEDRAEALENFTYLSFNGFSIKSFRLWMPEDWEQSICRWDKCEVTGIHN